MYRPPESELSWRFSRSSGPGGQGVGASLGERRRVGVGSRGKEGLVQQGAEGQGADPIAGALEEVHGH